MTEKLRIVHAITGLAAGGAEISLYRLLERIDPTRFESQVVSLTKDGPVGKKIRALGVPVSVLGMPRGVPDPVRWWRFSRWLRREAPHALQTWMYHADLIGGIAARLAGRIPVSWGLRQSNLVPGSSRRTTIWTAKACARLSRGLPTRIVCCSEATRAVHTELGYDATKLVVIDNGYDTQALQPDPAARASARAELGISEETPLVGLVARRDPQKNHAGFFDAARKLGARLPEAHFVLCGEGMEISSPTVARWVDTAGLGTRCHLLGRRDDIGRWNAALDVATCCSTYGEGFPNVVAEAMACGTPCVVTDVGDAARIVDTLGKVVPPGDAEALASAWYDLLTRPTEDRQELSRAVRQRIVENFSIESTVAKYEKLYTEIATRPPPRNPR